MSKYKDFYLLYRREGRDKVFIYDYLRKDEFHNLVQSGWKLLEGGE
mgnify:CR=1 FL=1